MDVARIVARVLDGNDASVRVLHRVGFRYVGTDSVGELLFELRKPQAPRA